MCCKKQKLLGNRRSNWNLKLLGVLQRLERGMRVLESVQILHHGLDTSDRRRRIQALHTARTPVQVGELLVEVRLHVRELRRDLGLEVLQARRDLLQDLRVRLLARRAELAHLTTLTAVPELALDVADGALETA